MCRRRFLCLRYKRGSDKIPFELLILSPDARQLITELDAYLTPLAPPESRHGYSVDKLIEEAVAFFVIRHERTPAGCGGIQLFDAEYGEVKRMYVRPHFRGIDLAKQMLSHLADYALQHGVKVLRLETGIYQLEAISLYERFGFHRNPPFGAYKEDPLSVFFEKRII
jgi:putative acetyltransferase